MGNNSASEFRPTIIILHVFSRGRKLLYRSSECANVNTCGFVVELVDTEVSKTSAVRRASSSLAKAISGLKYGIH